MAENLPTGKDRLKEITDSIEQGIKDLFQSDKYVQYLRTMSRFHRYSVNNTILIAMQRPDATLVAGFNKWRDQFERTVMKGEKGIKIIAPTPFKKKIEQEKLDPLTKTPLLDQNGKVLTEEKEVTIPMYKVVSVFDVSQTEGNPLPQLASSLTGDVRQFDIFMEALRRSSPVPLAFESMQPNMDGYFSKSKQRIAIRTGMSEVQTVSAAIHEITHAKLHNYEQARLAAAQAEETAEPPMLKDRHTEEVEAESVSYAVCAYYGIQTGENSFGYIAAWSKDKKLPELRASLETINKTASDLIDDVDRNYAEIVKERGVDLTAPEHTAEHPLPTVPDEPAPNPSESEPEPRTDTGQTERDLALEVPEPPNADDYPMPDPAMSIEARNAYGYTDDNMLPLSRERAIDLYEKDLAVYMLYEGNSAGMAFVREDIEAHTGIFGITREDWEDSRDNLSLVKGREASQKELEGRFLNNSSDAFAIYQLKDNDDLRDIRFEPMSRVQSLGCSVERDNYDLVYTDRLTNTGSTTEKLSALWDQFNNDHPEDFRGHSLSVSDIVALKQNGVLSCHYVDSFGFQELSAFLKPENYLKNAEIAMEDDYGMIDGIINNGKNPSSTELDARAKAACLETRTSVLKQLAVPSVKQPERNKTAPFRGAEMEL